MSEAIFVEGLTKAYNGKTVLDHLNLSVKSGTVFGLLGANGAGKSTTIACMLGTKQADCGTVRLLGQDPKKCRRACTKSDDTGTGTADRPVVPVNCLTRPAFDAVRSFFPSAAPRHSGRAGTQEGTRCPVRCSRRCQNTDRAPRPFRPV